MTLGLAFWVLMLIWFVFGIIQYVGYVGGHWAVAGNSTMLFVLFGLVGWQVFGPPLRRGA